jgi:hypothetical protein
LAKVITYSQYIAITQASWELKKDGYCPPDSRGIKHGSFSDNFSASFPLGPSYPMDFTCEMKGTAGHYFMPLHSRCILVSDFGKVLDSNMEIIQANTNIMALSFFFSLFTFSLLLYTIRTFRALRPHSCFGNKHSPILSKSQDWKRHPTWWSPRELKPDDSLMD